MIYYIDKRLAAAAFAADRSSLRGITSFPALAVVFFAGVFFTFTGFPAAFFTGVFAAFFAAFFTIMP